ncbi:piggyBac transposable element-derived protein 4 [Trichonephila clavipes]|nr:piggyBac transposable element-derived protein 4 [Trichonephila clavipes]
MPVDTKDPLSEGKLNLSRFRALILVYRKPRTQFLLSLELKVEKECVITRITENNYDMDSDGDSKVSVNDSRNTSLWNAFTLYQKLGGKSSHLYFRFDIINHLTKRHGAVNEKEGRPGMFPNPLRWTERHFLKMAIPTDEKLGLTVQCFMSCKKIKLGDIPIVANSLKCGTTRAVKTLNSILGFTEFDDARLKRDTGK